MNLVDLDILDSERVEQDNPFVTINMNGEETVMIPLEYLYNLSSVHPKPKSDVLDKIRAEIEFEVDHRTNMLCAEDVFEIIDKYKESEGKE